MIFRQKRFFKNCYYIRKYTNFGGFGQPLNVPWFYNFWQFSNKLDLNNVYFDQSIGSSNKTGMFPNVDCVDLKAQPCRHFIWNIL